MKTKLTDKQPCPHCGAVSICFPFCEGWLIELLKRKEALNE